MMAANLGEGATPPHLHPITFIHGSNTTPEVKKAQLEINVLRDLPWLEMEPLKNKPLVIVAGGPSLKYRWPEILTHNGDILALNNTYGFLLDCGIIPNFWMLLDAREDNVDFLHRAHPDVMHYVAGQAHPAIFNRLKGFKTNLYLTAMPETDDVVGDMDRPKIKLSSNVGTVGMMALSLAYVLGYRELHLYGYDSSYADGAHHAYAQPLNDDARILDVWLEGREYSTTASMALQATEFCGLVRGMQQAYGFDIELHCNGLLPDLVAFNNKQGKIPLEQREREKYEAMWSHDTYRKTAPGESMVDQAIDGLGMKDGDFVIDFGCGTGRGAALFKKKGFQITAIDFASNCLDDDIDVHFVEACLWDLPEISADWGYCTDVMEHIPMEKVMDVLAGIAKRCSGAFFNIATRDDALGVLIGRKLHMTVLPAANWLEIMRHYWTHIEMSEQCGEVTFICKQPKELP